MSTETQAALSTEVIEEAKKPPTPLELIEQAMYGYLWGFAERRWGEYGTVGRGLRFTTQGIGRLASIFGFIAGVSVSNREIAEKMANCIIRHLDGLSNYGGTLDEKGYVPKFIVELSDDGTLHGFGVLWFLGVTKKQKDEHPNKDTIRWAERFDMKYPDPAYCYAFSFNGGLLYHGPGGGEVFAVTLGRSDNFWSIHT